MGKLSSLMYVCHDVCMVVRRGVVSFGSFLCLVAEDWKVVAEWLVVYRVRFGGRFLGQFYQHLGVWP